MNVADAAFINPFDDRTLLSYYSAVGKWHGYIRFLGFDQLLDTPDVPIEKLFVRPRVSKSLIAPNADNEFSASTSDLVEVLREYPRLVLLGDPGSGKSTLVSWLASRLTLRGAGGLTQTLGRYVPIPMILRELSLSPDLTWDGLRDAFLAHRMAEALSPDDLEPLLASGQAWIMLDGIDEIGHLPTREALRRAVHEGMARYPECRWLLTSRVLGFSEVPFDLNDKAWERRRFKTVESGRRGSFVQFPLFEGDGDLEDYWHARIDADERTVCPIWYVAPFDDDQVGRFIHGWYSVRATRPDEADSNAEELFAALQNAPDTRALGRVPNLLTMMAIVHRNRAILPHGRARLYEEIVRAYLGGIDVFRKIDILEQYPYEQKRSWLAHVALQMQLRRDEDDGAILASEGDVREWLKEAIAEAYPREAEEIAERFLHFVARRSGLLIPRTETQYAFVHLSFLEFFAAFRLKEHVTSPEWLMEDVEPPTREDVREFAVDDRWSEVLLFMFQLLEVQPKWADRLYRILFEPAWVSPRLASRLVMNRYTGLTDAKRQDAMASLWRLAWQERDRSVAFELAFGDRRDLSLNVLERVRKAEPNFIVEVVSPRTVEAAERLLLYGGGAINLRLRSMDELAALGSLTSLTTLDLSGTQVTDADLTSLNCMTSLVGLDLSHAQVTDEGMTSIRSLTSLKTLHLWGTKVTDAGMTSLSSLPSLMTLNLWSTHVTGAGLASLGSLTSLTTLYLSGILVMDAGLASLGSLTSLTTLFLLDAGFTGAGLRSLGSLTSLTTLYLWGTGIRGAGLESLGSLTSLRTLHLSDTDVMDVNLSSLGSLTSLTSLDLSGTQVTDAGLASLGSLTSLTTLNLWRTGITDAGLVSLGYLTSLTSLNLSGTQITDAGLVSLGYLTSLTSLNLSGTQITDAGLVSLRSLTSLTSLDLSGTQVTDAGLASLRSLTSLTVNEGLRRTLIRRRPEGSSPCEIRSHLFVL